MEIYMEIYIDYMDLYRRAVPDTSPNRVPYVR